MHGGGLGGEEGLQPGFPGGPGASSQGAGVGFKARKPDSTPGRGIHYPGSLEHVGTLG